MYLNSQLYLRKGPGFGLAISNWAYEPMSPAPAKNLQLSSRSDVIVEPLVRKSLDKSLRHRFAGRDVPQSHSGEC